jgi:serine/threonine protein kinase
MYSKANILLDDRGHALLADFGLAVITDSPLAATNRGGSLRWMAPELLHPESYGFKEFQRTFASDIYSFACVCLEVCALTSFSPSVVDAWVVVYWKTSIFRNPFGWDSIALCYRGWPSHIPFRNAVLVSILSIPMLVPSPVQPSRNGHHYRVNCNVCVSIIILLSFLENHGLR